MLSIVTSSPTSRRLPSSSLEGDGRDFGATDSFSIPNCCLSLCASVLSCEYASFPPVALQSPWWLVVVIPGRADCDCTGRLKVVLKSILVSLIGVPCLPYREVRGDHSPQWFGSGSGKDSRYWRCQKQMYEYSQFASLRKSFYQCLPHTLQRLIRAKQSILPLTCIREVPSSNLGDLSDLSGNLSEKLKGVFCVPSRRIQGYALK